MTLRELAASACRTAAALLTINQVYGCGGVGDEVTPEMTADPGRACEPLSGDAFRAFQNPQELQDRHGYPPLTPGAHEDLRPQRRGGPRRGPGRRPLRSGGHACLR
jgi:hypothetical protein